MGPQVLIHLSICHSENSKPSLSPPKLHSPKNVRELENLMSPYLVLFPFRTRKKWMAHPNCQVTIFATIVFPLVARGNHPSAFFLSIFCVKRFWKYQTLKNIRTVHSHESARGLRQCYSRIYSTEQKAPPSEPPRNQGPVQICFRCLLSGPYLSWFLDCRTT